MRTIIAEKIFGIKVEFSKILLQRGKVLENGDFLIRKTRIADYIRDTKIKFTDIKYGEKLVKLTDKADEIIKLFGDYKVEKCNKTGIKPDRFAKSAHEYDTNEEEDKYNVLITEYKKSTGHRFLKNSEMLQLAKELLNG